MTPPRNARRRPPYGFAGLLLTFVCVAVGVLIYQQFRGAFASTATLTVMAPRAGLVMDTGSKVTLNGVAVGRVTGVEEVDGGGRPSARVLLAVESRYAAVIPANVHGEITASTVFGNKYVALTQPARPDRPITPADVIDVSATGVTTEFNTLFESVTKIAERIDPVDLNMTLTATADALTGLGDKFGRSIVDANNVLAELNPRMPQVRYDLGKLADLVDVYNGSAHDLFDALRAAVTTARTLNSGRESLDSALLAAVGFGNLGADVVDRAAPYFVRGQVDLVPTTRLLDDYSPELLCTIRNYHDAAPKIAEALGRNGYAAATATEVIGSADPYVYPDNLPRINARGGPGGRPGCWQPITKDLWPAPQLVMDSGASLAPYNHFGLGQPLFNEYVWGRQVGEFTINP